MSKTLLRAIVQGLVNKFSEKVASCLKKEYTVQDWGTKTIPYKFDETLQSRYPVYD